MIKLKTILSSFDDKATLLKWLKKVEKALASDILEEITSKAVSATQSKLVFRFADGTEIETPAFTIKGDRGPQGPQGDRGPQGLMLKESVSIENIKERIYISIPVEKFNIDPQYIHEGDYFFFINVEETKAHIVYAQVDTQTASVIEAHIIESIPFIFNAETLSAVIEGSETIIVDVAEDGEHVEIHLDADVAQKINKALQLPTTHTERKIVAVDATGAQEMLSIGDGLSVEAGKLKALGGGGGATLYAHTITQPKTQVDASLWLTPTYHIINNQSRPITSLNQLKINLRSWPHTIVCDFETGEGGPYGTTLYEFGFKDGNDGLICIGMPALNGDFPTTQISDSVQEL